MNPSIPIKRGRYKRFNFPSAFHLSSLLVTRSKSLNCKEALFMNEWINNLSLLPSIPHQSLFRKLPFRSFYYSLSLSSSSSHFSNHDSSRSTYTYNWLKDLMYVIYIVKVKYEKRIMRERERKFMQIFTSPLTKPFHTSTVVFALRLIHTQSRRRY